MTKKKSGILAPTAGFLLFSMISPALSAADTKRVDRGSEPGQVKVNPTDGQRYVWIPPGKFTTGSTEGNSEFGGGDKKPAHQVTIATGFWLGQTAVTQEAYQRLTGTNPSVPRIPTSPVERVNWNEAQGYCHAVGGRLPTGEEWVYAARAGDGGSGYLPEHYMTWWDGLNPFYKLPRRRPNAWGLYDMLGNVWQWTDDPYTDRYPGNSETDPRDPASAWGRAVRGGDVTSLSIIHFSVRLGLRPEARIPNLGFRCLMN